MPRSLKYPPTAVLAAALLTATLLPAGTGLAQEVQIIEQWARANAAAAAPCPPDTPPAVEDLAYSEDLTSFVGTALADTSGPCGAASADAGITTSITDSTITVDFHCNVNLADHRYAEGGTHFVVRFQISGPSRATLRIQGSFAYEDSLTEYSCGIGFWGDHYEVTVDQPTIDVTAEHDLTGGVSMYTLEGGCNALRYTRIPPDFLDRADGVTNITGSVTLTFHDAAVVAGEKVGWGDLKAQYR